MNEFLISTKEVWLILHLFAMVLGLGGATYSDILLIRFLKDFKISKKEAEVIHTMSRVILTGVALALISGLLLYLPNQEEMLQKSKFLVKMIAFAVLTLNGIGLHLVILPKLIHFSFHKNHYFDGTKISLRHLGFVMGAISFVSWYTVFLLGALRYVSISFPHLLAIYLVLLFGAIGVSLLIERGVRKHVKNH